MDFTDALNAKTTQERNDLIKRQILYWEEWCERLTESVEYGGMPDEPEPEVTRILDLNERIYVYVHIDYIESVPSSCKDYNHPFPGRADFCITIDRHTGKYKVEDHEDDGGSDFYRGDYQ